MPTITVTQAGEQHRPRVPHHPAAWGGIKELLRASGGSATREEILKVLKYCWHDDPQFCPNTAYLDYAIEQGWLVEAD
jgi:hypothetical protein